MSFFPDPAEELRQFLIHVVLPILLFLFAGAIVFFGRVKIGLALLVAAILVLAGLYLWGVFDPLLSGNFLAGVP